MKLGSMQPYFFPYLGYISLIKHTDKWIVLDTVQYIRHGWINRNRILKPGEGWQYIIVTIKKHSQKTLIKDIEISNTYEWKSKILRQLEIYNKKALYYNRTIELLSEIFEYETDSISDFNVYALKKTCNFLDIPFNYGILSEMGLKIENVNEPDDWALQEAQKLGAKKYFNPIGGLEFFNREKFRNAGIDISFLKIRLKEY